MKKKYASDAEWIAAALADAPPLTARQIQTIARLLPPVSAPAQKPDVIKEDVYFIQKVDGGDIKIGISFDVRARLGSLATQAGMEMKLLGVIPRAGRDTEKALHRRFSQHRLMGEWFRNNPELLFFISEECA
jgi:hypothetical protein